MAIIPPLLPVTAGVRVSTINDTLIASKEDVFANPMFRTFTLTFYEPAANFALPKLLEAKRQVKLDSVPPT